MKPPGAFSRRSALSGVTICLALNLAILAGIRARRPDYLRHYLVSGNPDAVHYVLIGRNFWLHGEYSRNVGPPYRPDMLRTPVYPLFAGGLDLLGGPLAIYLAQIALLAGSCLMIYALTASLFGERAGFWAQLFLASDLMIATSNFEAMSEGMCIFLTLSACGLLTPRLFTAQQPRLDFIGLAVGSLCMALAILVRPVVLYLPIGLTVLAVIGGLSGQTPRRLAAISIMLVMTYLPVGLWIARNWVTFSVPRLTTVDVNNLVYFVGAGAYEVEHGLNLEAAQAKIAEEFHLEPYNVVQNAQTAPRPVAEMDAELQAAKWKVLSRYPRSLVVACLKGLLKATISHNVNSLANFLALPWSPPGAASILSGDSRAIERFSTNEPVLVLALLWQMAHVIASVCLGLVGVILALRTAFTRPAGAALLACLAYFFLTIALFGLEAYSRCRTLMLPFLYIFAGCAVARSVEAIREKQRNSF